jgi:hypothetical protein
MKLSKSTIINLESEKVFYDSTKETQPINIQKSTCTREYCCGSSNYWSWSKFFVLIINTSLFVSIILFKNDWNKNLTLIMLIGYLIFCSCQCYFMEISSQQTSFMGKYMMILNYMSFYFVTFHNDKISNGIGIILHCSFLVCSFILSV